MAVEDVESIENPHEYDDEEFTEAANACQEKVPQLVEALWNGGASVKDIRGELQNALENCECFEGCRVKLELEVVS